MEGTIAKGKGMKTLEGTIAKGMGKSKETLEATLIKDKGKETSERTIAEDKGKGTYMAPEWLRYSPDCDGVACNCCMAKGRSRGLLK